MNILRTKVELRDALGALDPKKTVGLVPTMGFLHEGHVSLMRRASAECDFVVATIFVNPTQFAEGEDLDSYPRDAEGDAAKCEAAGVGILWTPDVRHVYQTDHTTEVHVSGLTAGLCGTSRPEHFSGVTTIVSKLFNIVGPDRAYFGEKDYQQLAVIRRMVRDLDFPIEIIGVPIVRDHDGLALSSRNTYLSASERDAALSLSRALAKARDAWKGGERRPVKLRRLIRDEIESTNLTRVDYVELVDPVDLEDLTQREEPVTTALAALAVHVGNTRLIDNRRLDLD